MKDADPTQGEQALARGAEASLAHQALAWDDTALAVALWRPGKQQPPRGADANHLPAEAEASSEVRGGTAPPPGFY